MKVLFVCTGNTCRSPMAEYLLRRRLAERQIQGVEVMSAGLCISGGAPISANSAAVLREWGIGTEGFTSRPVSPEAVAEADLVLTMTEAHRKAIAEALPQFAGKIQTLSDGGDITDPYGGDIAVYRAARDEIDACICRLLEDGCFG